MRAIAGIFSLIFVLASCQTAAEETATNFEKVADALGGPEIVWSSTDELPPELAAPVPGGGDVILAEMTADTSTVTIRWPSSEYEALVSFYEDYMTASHPNATRTDSSDVDGVERQITIWIASGLWVTVDECRHTDGRPATCAEIQETRDGAAGT